MSGWLGRLFGFGKKGSDKRANDNGDKPNKEKSGKAAKSKRRASEASAARGDAGRVPPKVRPARRAQSKALGEMTDGAGSAPKETPLTASDPVIAEEVFPDADDRGAGDAGADNVGSGEAGSGATSAAAGTQGKASDMSAGEGESESEAARSVDAVSSGEAAADDKRTLLQQGAVGEYVRRVQSALVSEGFDLGSIDGVFGRMTFDALKRLQKKLGIKPDGVVSFGLWRDVTKQPVPDVFARCLQITSSFEGHGFTKISGNFDNAGVTWGTIGYNIRSRSLQPILDYFIDYRPDMVREAFGPLAEELVRVMESSLEEQMTWGDQISIGTQKHRISREWADAFARFGAMDEVQEMQIKQAREKYWTLAERDRKRFDLTSELGAALAFDIAVQCGGIDGGDDSGPELREIERRFAAEKPKRERDRRVIIADVVAHHSHPRYVFDVLSRKMTLATGEGTVHGKSYTADHWGLGDYPLADS